MSQYVLLWSQRQNSLHVEPLENLLENNRRAYRDNVSTDYQVLLMGSREDVDATAENLRPTLKARTADRVQKVPV